MRFLLLALSGLAVAQTPSILRLPEGAAPVRYEAELTLDPAQPEFSGVIRVHVRFDQPAALLWLNARDLAIESAEWDGISANAEPVDNELLRVTLPSPASQGVLMLRYKGRLSDKQLDGAYRKQVAGEWYVFTTFTAIEARRVFPCFDDPRFKAPWRLVLNVPRGLEAAANYPAARSEETPEGWQRVEFAETLPLPSEVVAFAVGPFDIYGGPPAGRSRVPVRVLTARGQRASAQDAAEASDSVVRWLEDYTDLAYPWPKLDHVALPEGSFGAVENPGLITYRRELLLTPKGDATDEWRRRMRNLQAHELAHQWFGNLVTQAAWDDVWLSEGFATFLAAKFNSASVGSAAGALAIAEARERTMTIDESPRARAVRKLFTDRAGMKDVYSRVVYDKGAAVLHQLEALLGEESLRDALRRYLANHAHGTARTEDLLAVLPEPARPVLQSLLTTTGVPRVQFSGDTRACAMGKDVSFSAAACPAWILPASGTRGYYRTEYTVQQVEPLTVAWASMAPDVRLTVLYDLAAQVKRGTLTRQQVQPLAELAAREDAPAFRQAARGLDPK